MATMSLSEAMRLGSMTTRPTRNTLCRTDDETGAILETCAMGAAYVAAGVLYAGKVTVPPPDDTPEWHWAYYHLAEAIRCPDPGCRPMHFNSVLGVILHLNDDHDWSREAIADWVADVERATERARARATASVPQTVED